VGKLKTHIMNAEIPKIIQRLENGMLDFMTEGDAPYKKESVDKCIQIIKSYLDSIEKSRNKEEGLEVVKKTVHALNDLNADCEHCLIETDQREDLAEIIIIAGNDKGYNELTEDITEEWREW
jgi:hypothetical protein